MRGSPPFILVNVLTPPVSSMAGGRLPRGSSGACDFLGGLALDLALRPVGTGRAPGLIPDMIRAGTTSDNEDRTYASVDKGLQSSQLHRVDMVNFFRTLWRQEEGQDIAEYAVMLAVILVLVVGTVRLIGGNANNAFSATASAIAQ